MPEQPSTATLLAALHDLNRDVRQEAAIRLGTVTDERHVPELVQQLVADPDFFVRETLAWALVRHQEAALPALVDALQWAGGDGLAHVLHALSKLMDRRSSDAILPFADDADPAVAAKARWALARMEDPRVVPLLVAHLGSPEEEQRSQATQALHQLGGAATAGLADALKNEDVTVRRHAAEVLGALGSPAAEDAAPTLAGALDDSDEHVRTAALSALSYLKGEDAAGAVAGAVDHQDDRVAMLARYLAERRGG